MLFFRRRDSCVGKETFRLPRENYTFSKTAAGGLAPVGLVLEDIRSMDLESTNRCYMLEPFANDGTKC